ncbi:MAG: family 43 glycosylhydrolase [Prevotellaceae bacterium]|nr:family 43 glycosylhydrolase [Candidatus Minthosoma caballi]
MKIIHSLTILIAATLVSCSPKLPETQLTVNWRGTLKMDSAYNNPLVDFIYTADPTAVEHDGRLYVYGTYDQQQCDETHPDSANTYERINSLAMMSTTDMVNWTYHGIIPTKKLAPWIIASWAPTICSRVEADGNTHFYLYFSNSGFGTGVLTATSPVGPWTSPLEHSIVDAKTPGLGDCNVPFDPGVVIDGNGTGWLAFGAGKARIAKLGADMLSFDSPFVEIKAPHHFEANELNVIGGKLVYTYNIDWQPKDDWTLAAEKPSICSMAYMLPEGDPLSTDSWRYQYHYIKNPGEDGFEYSNNHTHLHKYQGEWYLFGHTMSLKSNRRIKGGYRNMCVQQITMDEENARIGMSRYTHEGVKQIRPLDPFAQQEMETTAATVGIRFEAEGKPGNMVAMSDSTGAIMVRGAEFGKKAKTLIIHAQGEGQIDVRLDSPEGQLLASSLIQSPSQQAHTLRLIASPEEGTHSLVFLLQGKTLRVDKWQMK